MDVLDWTDLDADRVDLALLGFIRHTEMRNQSCVVQLGDFMGWERRKRDHHLAIFI
jgi:hypothetical protein